MVEMSLKEYWRESLLPFKKNNLKMFLLGTMATSIRAATTLLSFFWWIVPTITGIALGCLYCAYNYSRYPRTMLLFSGLLLVFGIILVVAFWYLILLASRPSLELKTKLYFSNYMRTWWVVLILAILVPSNNLATITAAPMMTIILLFFFDTDLSVDALAASFIRGTKAFIYFLPGLVALMFMWLLCLISMLGFCWTMSLLISWLMGFVGTSVIATLVSSIITVMLATIIAIKLFILFAAAVTVYYVKIKHEHHDLFFV
ncbi:MAG: hypothetical protein WC365_09435 [Candidatus Babeliales bacterium]|jgi:hypothetical protein